jgi:hypothetical protein
MDEVNPVPDNALTAQPGTAPPSFSRSGTVVWSLALVILGGWVLWSVSRARDQGLDQPETYLSRIVGRDLDAAEATPRLPKWQRFLNAWTSSNPSDALDEAIATYQDFRENGLLAGNDTAASALAVFLGEAGRTNELKTELERLPEERARVLDQAYLESGPGSRYPRLEGKVRWECSRITWMPGR